MTMELQLEKLYKSSIKLLQPFSLEETYQAIVDEALRLVDADAGSILLEKRGSLIRVYSSDPRLFTIEPRKRGFMYQVYKENKPRILSNKQIAKVHPEIQQIELHTDLIIPLSYRKKRLGVLTIVSRKNNKFTKNDLTTLKLFGPLASLAIIKSGLHEEVQSALDTRNLFISLASHELKTPLTTLTMYTELLKKRINKGEEIKPEWVSLIHDETKWLNVLFNELLLHDQINERSLNYKWKKNSIEKLVKRAQTHFNAQFGEHTLVVKNNVEPDETLYSDFDKLLQVLTNILGNAGKFSPPNEKIIFQINKKGDKYLFSIQDRGRGIEKEDLPKIYNGFYKGKGNTKKGMGLGLFLSREIISLHRGKMTITSKPNSGTKVNILIPNI